MTGILNEPFASLRTPGRKYRLIHKHRTQFQVQQICDVMGVSRSGYYAWLGRPVRERMNRSRQLTRGTTISSSVLDAFMAPKDPQVSCVKKGFASDSRRWPDMRGGGHQTGSVANIRRSSPIRTDVAGFVKTGSNHLSRPNGRIAYVPTDEGALPRQHHGSVHLHFQIRGVACRFADDQGACAPSPGHENSA
jgi:hypothetical protein